MLKKFNDYKIIILFFKIFLIQDIIRNDGIITAVPESFFKKMKKGRSSLYYLLKLFAKSEYKVIKDIYKRKIFKLKAQKNKKGKQRFFEVENMYYIPKKHINKYNGKVYLIDDIYTTGSTVNYGAKLLKEAGFDEVHVITFFRAKINKY
jgi:predicted amidophosphoribosyltransferase